MQAFTDFAIALYPVGQFFAGVGAFAVFIYVMVSVGFTMKSEPGSGPSAIGGGFLGAILAGFLAVGPLYSYEGLFFNDAQFPRPGFALAFWIGLAVVIAIGVYMVIEKGRKLAWLMLLPYLLLALVVAAWVAKTVNVIGHAFTVSLLAGLFFGLLGLIYILLYACAPAVVLGMALDNLPEAKKTPEPTTTQSA